MRTRRINQAAALSLTLLTATALTQAHASDFKLIYSFDSTTSGAPNNLVAINGKFYGTTSAGFGTSQCGSFFEVTPSGTETLLHTFQGGADCAPNPGLAQILGRVYGTTLETGDAPRGGEVFSLSLQGNEAITYMTGKSQSAPSGFIGITAPGGALIVTSQYGGVCKVANNGTVFALNKSTSVTRLIHSFCSNGGDGETPTGPVVSVNGTLYGTTIGSGAYTPGQIFSISPSGISSVLYSFSNFPKGGNQFYPNPLSYIGGHLYGTYTSVKGNVLYTVDLAGNLTILHTFTSTEGEPVSGLVAIGTTLYGVSQYALYSLDAAGNFAIVHQFPSDSSSPSVTTGGLYPSTTPIYLGGSLYGATKQGGANNAGAIYKYTP